jgi:hypothetical protein
MRRPRRSGDSEVEPRADLEQEQSEVGRCLDDDLHEHAPKSWRTNNLEINHLAGDPEFLVYSTRHLWFIIKGQYQKVIEFGIYERERRPRTLGVSRPAAQKESADV